MFYNIYLEKSIINKKLIFGEKMKETLKLGLAAFGKLVLVNFLCAIIVLSISILTSNFMNEEYGYNVYGTLTDESETELLYTHLFEDGEDTKRAEYEQKGYKEITEEALTRSTKAGDIVFLTISQIFSWATLAAIIYPSFWRQGSKDRNQVHFGHIAEDKLKGFKAGLVAIIPAAILMVFFMFAKYNIAANFPAVWLKFLNSNGYSFIHLIQNKALLLSEVSIIGLLLIIVTQLIVPVITHIAYTLGYKDIAIAEKLLYKKKEG